MKIITNPNVHQQGVVKKVMRKHAIVKKSAIDLCLLTLDDDQVLNNA